MTFFCAHWLPTMIFSYYILSTVLNLLVLSISFPSPQDKEHYLQDYILWIQKEGPKKHSKHFLNKNGTHVFLKLFKVLMLALILIIKMTLWSRPWILLNTNKLAPPLKFLKLGKELYLTSVGWFLSPVFETSIFYLYLLVTTERITEFILSALLS